MSRHHSRPQCSVSPDNVWQSICSNYTYAARSYSTDQILISKDFPCQAMISGTSVKDCDTSEDTSGEPVYIGVFGYTASRFTITVSPSGGIQTLVTGRPQPSFTSPGYDCSSRDRISGACAAKSATKESLQVAYFTFTVAPVLDNDGLLVNEVTTVSVQPTCDSSQTCSPGCACNPLYLYMNSCLSRSCTEADARPSRIAGQNDESLAVDSTGSSLVIDQSRGFCGGAGGSSTSDHCVYYLAVATHNHPKDAAQFTITVRSAGEATLVPCAARSDGSRGTVADSLASETRTYEICSAGDDEQATVAVEFCSVSASVFWLCSESDHCADSVPGPADWAYRLSSNQITSRSGDNTPASTPGIPSVTLPAADGNTFMRVNGTGAFEIHVKSTIDGLDQSPTLVSVRGPAQVEIGAISSDEFAASWPLVAALHPARAVPSPASLALYTVYVYEVTLAVMLTPCGLRYAKANYPDRVFELTTSPTAAEVSSAQMRRKIPGLARHTAYHATVLASCDSNCLRQVAKTVGGSVCLDKTGCETQHLVYSAAAASTASSSSSTPTSSSFQTQLFAAGLVAIVAVVIVLASLVYYWQRTMKAIDPDYKLTEMVDSSMFSSHSAAGSSHGTISFDSSRAQEAASPRREEYKPPVFTLQGLSTSLSGAARRAWDSSSGYAKLSKSSTNPLHQDEDEEVEISL